MATQPGGALKSGADFPVSTEQVTIERVLRMTEGHITLECRYNDRAEFFDFVLAADNTAESLVKILT